MAILLKSASGSITTGTTLEAARTANNVIEVIVTSALNSTQSNITVAWGTTRTLTVVKGGSIGNTTAFDLTGTNVIFPQAHQVFTGSGAVSGLRNVTPELFGGIPGVTTATMYAAMQKVWSTVLSSPGDIELQGGTYDVGENNFPFRNTENNTGLLDAHNITIRGKGRTTILKTTSVGGADVLQLNALKNIHIRSLAVTSTISGASAGSNGISITNGFDNITIDDVYVYDLGYLDKTSYIDGGKALTIQTGVTSNPIGTLVAQVTTKGCVEGFGFEPDLVTQATNPTSVVVDIIAEDCYTAVKYSAGAASGSIPASLHTGVIVRGSAINCQKDVVLGRAHGIDVDINVVTTKTEAARRLSPAGTAWFAADTEVCALYSLYAYNGKIEITGNKGACAYKANIGGAAAGSSGLAGATRYTDIFLNVGGTASVSDIAAVDSGGNSLLESKLTSTVLTGSIPADFSATTLKNTLRVIGQYSDQDTELTWTPTVAGSSGGSPTYVTQQGKYVRDGSLVSVSGYVEISAKNALAGNIYIGNLPFSSEALVGNYLATISSFGGLATSVVNFVARVNTSDNTLGLFIMTAAGTSSGSALQASDISNTFSVAFGLEYRAVVP